MEDFVQAITRDNVTEVKVVLTSVVAALALYQVLLMAVGYGKVKLPFLTSRAASVAHRSAGDGIVAVTLIVGFMCISYFGIEDGEDDEEARALLHVILGTLLVGMIALKVIVVRWWHSAGRYLPVLGLTVFTLFVLTWLTSSADYLWHW